MRLQHPQRADLVVDVPDGDRQLIAYYRGEGYLVAGGQLPAPAEADGQDNAQDEPEDQGEESADTDTSLDLG